MLTHETLLLICPKVYSYCYLSHPAKIVIVRTSAANSANSNLSTEASAEKQEVDMAKDAYQVSVDEYDEFFATRYGLLYQKFSDAPFTGRIVTMRMVPRVSTWLQTKVGEMVRKTE